ncbi:hypothetical protein LMG26854_00606 [Achromobacter aegrifaciens]|nr:hypothetical protein LMG26854_00606 [Achromobacter aegrifaciens]
MSERGQGKSGRSKLGRWVALGVLAVIAVAAGAYVYVERSQTQNFQRSALEGSVAVYAYNFTQYDVAYSLMPGRRWFARANSARGDNMQLFGYKPAAPDAPMQISWRYDSGPQETAEEDYPFVVTLPQPRRPAGAVVLELRIYPDGKAAARYVTRPLVSEFSDVDPALPGNDWVTNQ